MDRWSDGYPDTWEDEESVSPHLLTAFEEQRMATTAGGRHRTGGLDVNGHLPHPGQKVHEEQSIGVLAAAQAA